MNQFQRGAALRVTFCDKAVFEREVGRVFADGAFRLVGAPLKQRWCPAEDGRAYPAAPAIDSAAFIVMAKPKGKT